MPGGVPAGAARHSFCRVPNAGLGSLAHANHPNPHPNVKGEETVLLPRGNDSSPKDGRKCIRMAAEAPQTPLDRQSKG